ncbi:hypothetical protein ABIE33_003767 [Ensifer sp. 4252]
MSFIPGRLIEPPLPSLVGRSGCRLRAGGRKGGFAVAGTQALVNPTIASHALAAFALRGRWKLARDIHGKKRDERPIDG